MDPRKRKRGGRYRSHSNPLTRAGLCPFNHVGSVSSQSEVVTWIYQEVLIQLAIQLLRRFKGHIAGQSSPCHYIRIVRSLFTQKVAGVTMQHASFPSLGLRKVMFPRLGSGVLGMARVASNLPNYVHNMA